MLSKNIESLEKLPVVIIFPSLSVAILGPLSSDNPPIFFAQIKLPMLSNFAIKMSRVWVSPIFEMLKLPFLIIGVSKLIFCLEKIVFSGWLNGKL